MMSKAIKLLAVLFLFLVLPAQGITQGYYTYKSNMSIGIEALLQGAAGGNNILTETELAHLLFKLSKDTEFILTTIINLEGIPQSVAKVLVYLSLHDEQINPSLLAENITDSTKNEDVVYWVNYYLNKLKQGRPPVLTTDEQNYDEDEYSEEDCVQIIF